MGYERIQKPEGLLYHYTRKENLESILRDGRIRKFCDRETWFTKSLADTLRLTIKYDEEKLNAVKQYMGKKDADFDAELKEVLGKMYEKYVPQAVREYIESRGDVPPAIKKANRQQGKNSAASGSAAENE